MMSSWCKTIAFLVTIILKGVGKMAEEMSKKLQQAVQYANSTNPSAQKGRQPKTSKKEKERGVK